MNFYETQTGQGYQITACYDDSGPFIPGALHVELDIRDWLFEDDDAAARTAQRDGVKLVYGIPYVEDGVYVDTPENRTILQAYSRRMENAVERRRNQRKP